MKKMIYGLALFGSVVHGANGDILNSRNAGMGGAGVAVSDYEVAGLYNPALLTVKEEKDSFAVILPNVGAEVSDQDEVADKIEDIADDFDVLEQALDSADGIAASAARDRIIDNLTLVDDKPVTVDLGAFVTVAIPGEKQGFALSVSGYSDIKVLARFDTDDIARINAATTPADFDNLETTLESDAKAVGVAIAEVALSYARRFDIAGRNVSIGISPKYQSVETIQYIQTVNDYDTDDFDADEYTTDDSDFNLDIGAAFQLNDKTLIAANLRDLVGSEYDTVVDPITTEQTTYEIRPTLTTAIAYQSSWLAATAEIDVTERSGFKDEDGPQFFRVGVEFDAANWVQLRLGYRTDMNDAKEDVATAGIGLSPFNVLHIGVAGFAGSNDTYGGAVDLKLTF